METPLEAAHSTLRTSTPSLAICPRRTAPDSPPSAQHSETRIPSSAAILATQNPCPPACRWISCRGVSASSTVIVSSGEGAKTTSEGLFIVAPAAARAGCPSDRVLRRSSRAVPLGKDVPHPRQMIAQQPRQQEVLAHPPRTRVAHLRRGRWILQQLGHAGGELLSRVREVAADPVLQLVRDPARTTRDHRRPLPQRLGDHEPEPLPRALLDRHVCHALERVHLVARHAHLVGEQETVALARGLALDLLVDPPRLGVIRRHRP